MIANSPETRVCRCGEAIEASGSAWIGATDGWETCLGTEDFHEPADDPDYLPAVIRYLTEETA